MKIIRYSVDGFKPKYQSYHLKGVHYHLSKFNIEDYPKWMRHSVLDIHNKIVVFYKENYSDFQYGIWAFIDGYKNSQSLNHLKHRVPCWSADISDDTIVYGVNWDKKLKITDDECKVFGFYIPANQLKTLKNIKRVLDLKF